MKPLFNFNNLGSGLVLGGESGDINGGRSGRRNASPSRSGPRGSSRNEIFAG